MKIFKLTSSCITLLFIWNVSYYGSIVCSKMHSLHHLRNIKMKQLQNVYHLGDAAAEDFSLILQALADYEIRKKDKGEKINPFPSGKLANNNTPRKRGRSLSMGGVIGAGGSISISNPLPALGRLIFGNGGEQNEEQQQQQQYPVMAPTLYPAQYPGQYPGQYQGQYPTLYPQQESPPVNNQVYHAPTVVYPGGELPIEPSVGHTSIHHHHPPADTSNTNKESSAKEVLIIPARKPAKVQITSVQNPSDIRVLASHEPSAELRYMKVRKPTKVRVISSRQPSTEVRYMKVRQPSNVKVISVRRPATKVKVNMSRYKKGKVYRKSTRQETNENN